MLLPSAEERRCASSGRSEHEYHRAIPISCLVRSVSANEKKLHAALRPSPLGGFSECRGRECAEESLRGETVRSCWVLPRVALPPRRSDPTPYQPCLSQIAVHSHAAAGGVKLRVRCRDGLGRDFGARDAPHHIFHRGLPLHPPPASQRHTA